MKRGNFVQNSVKSCQHIKAQGRNVVLESFFRSSQIRPTSLCPFCLRGGWRGPTRRQPRAGSGGHPQGWRLSGPSGPVWTASRTSGTVSPTATIKHAHLCTQTHRRKDQLSENGGAAWPLEAPWNSVTMTKTFQRNEAGGSAGREQMNVSLTL